MAVAELAAGHVSLHSLIWHNHPAVLFNAIPVELMPLLPVSCPYPPGDAWQSGVVARKCRKPPACASSDAIHICVHSSMSVVRAYAPNVHAYTTQSWPGLPLCLRWRNAAVAALFHCHARISSAARMAVPRGRNHVDSLGQSLPWPQCQRRRYTTDSGL